MEKKTINRKWMIGGVIYAVAFLLIITISNFSTINTWIAYALRILRPVIIGFSLAYIINPIFSFFERRMLCRLNPSSLRRFLSLLFSYLLMIILAACILLMIVPQLIESIVSLLKNYESIISSAVDYVNGWIAGINGLLSNLTQSDRVFESINAQNLLDGVTNLFASVSIGSDGGSLLDLINSANVLYVADLLTGMIAIIADLVLGIFISLYFLASKEKRAIQVMRARRAIFSPKANGHITHIVQCFDKSFGGFIKGKTLDCLIILLLLYMLFSLLNIPFALLLASFIAILNFIPVFGLFLGALPAAFIILLSAPDKIIPFLLIVIVVQQIDANIICPKILGNNTGISSLCTLIAIITAGAIWGVVGVVLAVPFFAAILTVSDNYLEKNLRKKGLPSEIESYYPSDALVDPVKDSHLQSEKLLKRLEKNVLRIFQKQKDNPEYTPTRREKSKLFIYKIFRKYNIISNFRDETIIQFWSEQEQHSAYKKAEEAFCAKYQKNEQSNDQAATDSDR